MKEQTKDVRDYLAILLKRKRYFFIPFLVLFIIVTAVALLLPAVYESTSTILIEDQQIPQEFVRSTVTGFADQRIQSLTQQILSRTRLWEIIQQFHLYPELKEKYTREEILQKMRENIRLDAISAEVATGQKAPARRPGQAGITIAFSISYRGQDPETVQKVAGTLASLYLEQNLKTREAQAKTTTQFLETEAKELRERIHTIGQKIAAFKEAHEGIQPELYQFNLSQSERTEQDIKQIDNRIRTTQDRKIYLEGQLATVKPDSPMIGSSGERVMNPQDRLRALEVKLADLQAKFSPDHPEVKRAWREKAELEKLVGQKGGSPSLKRQKLTQLEAELAQKQGKYSDEHPDIRKLKNEIARLKQKPQKAEPVQPLNDAENPAYISLTTQIESAKNEIASLERQLETLQEKRKVYDQRLEESPKLEQEYFALQRDYKNSTDKYQEVMNKILEARISEGMEEHQKGEKFILIDPASYPQKPVKPKRMLIILAGFILSLGSGLGTVALVEQLDRSVKNADELSSFTGFPVLGTIVRIRTKEEVILARRKQHFVWMISGLVLILGLTLFHFLYMDLWVLTAKLMRLAQKYT